MFFRKKVYFPFSVCSGEGGGVLTVPVLNWGLLVQQSIIWLLLEMCIQRPLGLTKSKVL